MNNIVSVKLDSRYASTLGVWQYDYGQVLRITGPELPPAVEVQFSLAEKTGETLSRVGTTVDGVTEVKIPDELLTHSATSNYRIYAYIYLTDETSGNTKYEITIPVRVRSKPTSPTEDPETDPDLFRETVAAVNASAERAKMAEQNAKESATEAGKYAASASESAVTAEKTKEDALRKVGEKKREAIEAIQNQEETSVGKITTHTDGEIQRIQNQATDSKAGLEQTITNAGVSKEELDESIQTASDTKTALDKSVELAGTAQTELDTPIREAGTAKTALDESTETAGTVQETLSATVKQAGALDASLGEKIETGTQLKTDLTASGEKAVQDIQTAGSEQLGKMQAVAEAFTADREQIATNKEDIGSLQEELGDIESKFEIETEAFSNKCSIIRNNTPNNFTGNQITGVKQYFDFGENAALTKIKMNIKASNDDTVVLEIATLDGNIIATGEKAVTTEYTDVVFDLENIVIKEPVSIFVYTKGTNLLSYGLYATPYDDQSFSYIFPDGTRKSAFKIGTSEIPKPTTSNNKQCLVLFFDYTSKIIKNISDSISQNIDTTLLKSGKAADAKVVGDKLSKLEEDLNNAIQSDILHNNNLWGLSDWSQTTSGVTISYDSETGIFTFNGTAIENTDKFVFNAAQISPLLEAGTYKLWCKTISGSSTGKNPAMNFGTGLATLPINYNSNKNLATSLTLTGTQNRYKISVIGGAVFDNLKLHIWVTSVDITNETDLGFQKYGETYKTHPVLNPNISIQRLDSHIENPSIHLSVDEKTYVTKAVSDKRNEDIFTSEIADTIEKTFVHQKNKNLCFAYISDTHTYISNTDSVGQYKMQMNHISKVNDVVSYDFLVHCGDFVNTQWLWNNSMIQDDEYQKYIRECVMELNTTGISNVFPVIGNHDSGFIPSTDPKTHGTEYSGYLANARTMGKILNNRSVVAKDVLKPYYYVDFEIYKIRCVYISTNCDSLTTDAKGIPYEETVWFKNVLETTPDDFNILLFGHIPFSRFTMGETTSSFLNLVNGFNTHTIVDNAGTSMDADFTGRTSKILVYICGHYHGDSVVMPDNEYSVMNCPEITIGSGGYLSSGVITSGNRYDDLDAPSRELGTITQDLWDSCVLDLEKYILYLTRFGAGNDRIVNLN